MRYTFHTADVFTDRVFGGNPLAVFPEAQGLTDEQMRNIAGEIGLSATTFVLPHGTAQDAWRLRIFTPSHELQFAGHPTVGTAFVLASEGMVPLDRESTRIVFKEGVGPVTVDIQARDGRPTFTQLTAAKLPEFGPAPPPSEHIAAMLSLDPTEVLDDADNEPMAISCGVPFLFVPLSGLDSVRRARLNWEWWQCVLAGYWAPHVYPFSYETEREGTDVHARAFAESGGMAEHPATGSAATALAGYLAPRAGRRDGTLRWTVEQGFEIGRPSTIRVETDVEAGAVTAVRVGGSAVMVSRGEIDVV